MTILENQGRPKEMKNGQITSFYLEKETVQGLDIIARREGMSKSRLGRQVLEDYVKVHAAGNAQYTLVHDFTKMSAYPTPFEPLDFKKLQGNSWKEDDEMIAKLDAVKLVLQRDKQAKRDAGSKQVA